MTSITVFLTAEDHLRRFTDVKSEADAISRIRTAKVVTFNYEPAGQLGDALEQVWELTNDAPCMTVPQQEAAWEYRYGGDVRSLSVGDVVHVEGLGIYSVGGHGWQRHTHRLTANACIHAYQRATSGVPQ